MTHRAAGQGWAKGRGGSVQPAGCAQEQRSHKGLTHGYLEKHTILSAPIKKKKKIHLPLQYHLANKGQLLNPQVIKPTGVFLQRTHIPQGLGLFTEPSAE